MARHELLNNNDHRNIKIITQKSAQYGDDVSFAYTFPDEFRALQAFYPICFHKDSTTGQILPVALLGFETQENLFLSDSGWRVPYVPCMLERQPFAIAKQRVQGEMGSDIQAVIGIDIESPRVNEAEGAPVFLEFGGNSPYLDRVISILEMIDEGMPKCEGFMQALMEHNLIESFTLEVELKDGVKNSLIGFYTINEESLFNLSDENILALHNRGYLQSIYMILASQGQFSRLIDYKSKLNG